MGCGGSTQARGSNNTGKGPETGEAPYAGDDLKKGTVQKNGNVAPNTHPTTREEDEDSEISSGDENDKMRAHAEKGRSKSVSRLEQLSKNRGSKDVEESPELFEWGDFLVDVKEVTKKPPAPKRNPRQPPKKLNTGKKGELFSYGDFTVPTDMDYEDDVIASAEMKAPVTNTRPKKELSEYRVRAFDYYALIGHSTRVKCICVSPNEGFFISCSNEDASMTMCNIQTGKEIMSFMGHEDTIISTCFSNDAKYLATTSRDNTMILWDVTTGKQILAFEHEKVVICCCFSKDSKFLVSGCQDKVCRIWETKKGREQICFTDHEGIIISVSFAPDSQSVVSASADKTLRVWKTAGAQCLHILRGHTGIVLSCSFRSDGQNIVSNDEKVLKIWEAANGKCQLSLGVDEVPRPNSLPGKKQTWTLSSYCPGPLGYFIIAACNSRTVHIFNPENGEEILALYCKAPVYCLSCGSDSKVAFGDSYGNVFIVNLQSI